jgi:hypothetical protein
MPHDPARLADAMSWAFRYLGDAEQPSAEEAQAALALAREVYEMLLAHVPGATGGPW